MDVVKINPTQVITLTTKERVFLLRVLDGLPMLSGKDHRKFRELHLKIVDNFEWDTVSRTEITSMNKADDLVISLTDSDTQWLSSMIEKGLDSGGCPGAIGRVLLDIQDRLEGMK